MRSTSQQALNANARSALERTASVSLVPTAQRNFKVSTEKKVYDITSNNAQVHNGGFIISLCTPSLGSDMNERNGRRICMKSVSIKGYIVLDAALGIVSPELADAQLIRVCLIWDYQPNGALPTIANIFTTNAPWAQLNLNNRDRFKMLHNETFTLDAFLYNNTATQSLAGLGRTAKHLDIYKRLSGRDTIFNGNNSGSVTSIASGNLLLVCVGSASPGAGDAHIYWSGRVRYEDY